MFDQTRRTLLKAGGSIATVGVLAGCTEQDDDEDENGEAEEDEDDDENGEAEEDDGEETEEDGMEDEE